MVVGDDVGDDGLLVRLVHVHVLRVQQLHQAELLLGQVEGVVEVVHGVALRQLFVLYQVRSEKRGMTEILI